MTGTHGGVGQLTVSATYRRDWTLFADWCAAYELDALPASTVTVARFLEFESHLAPATLRRRLTAINHTHTAAGYSAPGTITAIRRLLSVRDRHTTRAQHVIEHLPTSGWPGGLFGRRDALILTLTCILGIPIPDTATLTCADLTYHPETSTMHIGAGHDITLPATTHPHGPYAVWRRWAVVRDRMIRYPSPRAWARALHTATATNTAVPATPIAGGGPAPVRADAALFPALDRWGQPRTLDPTDTISPRAISHLIAAHLADTQRSQRSSEKTRTPWIVGPGRETASDTDADSDGRHPVLGAPVVDGARARRRALSDLATLEPVYTDIDHRTTELLARTETLLHEWLST